MPNYIIINKGLVVDTQVSDVFNPSLVAGAFDTVTEDPSGLFVVGDAYSIEAWENHNFTLDQWKDRQKSKIRSRYREESIKPVTVAGVNYHGGFDSAIKLDAEMRLSEAVGSTTTTFYGINNNSNILSIAEAKTVVLSVANAYQDLLATKQALMVAVDQSIDRASVEFYVWPYTV